MTHNHAAIVVDSVSRTFRTFWGRPLVTAVQHLSLEVPRGRVFGLLGPNGSGKTTTLNMMLGLLRPDAGSIHVLGAPAGSAEVRGRIGYLPEEFEPPEYLTGEEVLRFYGGLRGVRDSTTESTSDQVGGLDASLLVERINVLLDALDMQGARARKFREYSKGMRRRIGLAQAFLHDPELVILDEPTNGLDPIGVGRVKSLIDDFRSRGRTVLLSSHILPEVEEICEEVAVLRDGESLCVGSTEDLLRVGSDFEIRLRDCDESAAMQASARLEAEGYDVTEVRPARRSLESLFLELVEGEATEDPEEE